MNIFGRDYFSRIIRTIKVVTTIPNKSSKPMSNLAHWNRPHYHPTKLLDKLVYADWLALNTRLT